jgi:beta-glucosidase
VQKEPVDQKLNFPEGFFWGASTSSHQVEGGDMNDWSAWERKNCDRLAREAKERYEDASKLTGTFSDELWHEIRKQSIDPKNYVAGIACDQYRRYEEDFDLAKSLGLNAYRFSVDWARIEPEEGKFDEQEIEHYVEVVKALRKRDIEPFFTLWHWPIPLWMRDKGGWESREIVKYFGRFVEHFVPHFKGLVKFWITLNEPLIYTTNSFFKGYWPPGKKSIFSSFLVVHNLIKAHQKAYECIKQVDSSFLVGLSKNNVYFEAYRGRLVNRILKGVVDEGWNFYFLNKTQAHLDFIGLNHYGHNRINYGFNKNENKKVSDMGWELYPESIYHVLVDLKKYGKPIYITEHGLADAKDETRAWFIKESLKNVHRALNEGVDVKGYLHWSLLDNFEWDKGFWPKFGLLEVDFNGDLKRTVRKSAKEFSDLFVK